MVKTGHHQDAVQAGLKLASDHSKGQVISSIMRAQFQLGDQGVARETATTFAERLNDQWPVLVLSKELADAGKVQEAMETSSRLKEQLRFFALGHIAESLAKSGEIRKALDLASSIPSPMHRYEDAPTVRFRTVGRIAEIQAKNGNYKGAFSTALIIPSGMSACDIFGYWRDEVIHDIGNAQAQRGDFNLAIRTAEKLKKSTAYYGDEVIRTVTLSQARQGQIESALKTCNRFRSRDFRAKTYQDVAEEWVKRDDKETVMKWASQLPLKIEKAYALVGIARGVRHETEK